MIPLLLYVLFPLLASATSNQVSNANDINWFGNLISVIAGGLLHYKDGLVTTFVKNYTTYSSMAVFAILSLAFVKMFHKPTNLKLLVKWIVLQFVVVHVMYTISMGSDFVSNPIISITLLMLVVWIVWPVPHILLPDSKLGSTSSSEEVECTKESETIEFCIGHQAFKSTSLTAQASEINTIAMEWIQMNKPGENWIFTGLWNTRKGKVGQGNVVVAQYSRTSILLPKLSKKKSSTKTRAKSKTRKKITNSIGEEVEDEDIEKYRYERNWDASKKAYSYLDRKMGGSSWTVPADLNEKFVSWRDSVSYFFVV